MEGGGTQNLDFGQPPTALPNTFTSTNSSAGILDQDAKGAKSVLVLLAMCHTNAGRCRERKAARSSRFVPCVPHVRHAAAELDGRGGGERCLHLLGSPAGVGFAHVGGRLDLGDELENDVGEADDADHGARDDAEPAGAEEDGADEDVDY